MMTVSILHSRRIILLLARLDGGEIDCALLPHQPEHRMHVWRQDDEDTVSQGAYLGSNPLSLATAVRLPESLWSPRRSPRFVGGEDVFVQTEEVTATGT